MIILLKKRDWLLILRLKFLLITDFEAKILLITDFEAKILLITDFGPGIILRTDFQGTPLRPSLLRIINMNNAQSSWGRYVQWIVDGIYFLLDTVDRYISYIDLL